MVKPSEIPARIKLSDVCIRATQKDHLFNGRYKIQIFIDNGKVKQGSLSTRANATEIIWLEALEIGCECSDIVFDLWRRRNIRKDIFIERFRTSATDVLCNSNSKGEAFGIVVNGDRATLSFNFILVSQNEDQISLEFIRRQLELVPHFPEKLEAVLSTLYKLKGWINPLLRVAPGGQAACDLFEQILSYFNEHQARIGKLGFIVDDLVALLKAVDTIRMENADKLEILIDTVDDILRTAREYGECLMKFGKRSTFKHLVSSALSSEMDDSIEDFRRRIARNEALLRAMLVQTTIRVEGMHFRMGEAEILANIAQLKPVPSAILHSHYAAFETCLKGTRERVIDSAIRGITSAPGAYWIPGGAGTGKSTIAASIVHELRARGVIVANFFCNRDDQQRRDPQKVIPTLAYQLAQSIPEYRSAIADAIASTNARHLPLPLQPMMQLHFFIIDAFASIEKRAVVLLIDGLDECDEKLCTSFLQSLLAVSDSAIKLAKITFVVLSRKLDSFYPLGEQFVTLVDLDGDLESNDTSKDIRRFVEAQLSVISCKYRDKDWPSQAEIDMLTTQARGMFIWADVACRFVSQPSYREELTRLTNESKVNIGIDDLYFRTLNVEFSRRPNQTGWISDYRAIMGCILCSTTPLSVRMISELLGKRQKTVEGTLSILRPVLRLGSSEDDEVHLLHASLADYLLDPGRSAHLHVDPSSAHASLAVGCLQILISGLKDIRRHIIFASASTKTTIDLIPAHVNYSCLNWASHLSLVTCQGDEAALIEASLGQFLKMCFLFWLEALSLLDRVQDGIVSLHALCVWLKKHDLLSLQALAIDSAVFLETFGYPISISTVHIYLSALPFSPKNSLIANHYRALFPVGTIPTVTNGQVSDWPDIAPVAHIGRIRHGLGEMIPSDLLAFSRDRRRVALLRGSRDLEGLGKAWVSVWDTENGCHVYGPAPLSTRQEHAKSVSFEPDDITIAVMFPYATDYWNISDWDRDVNHPLLPTRSVAIGFESESPVGPNEFHIQASDMEEVQAEPRTVTQNLAKTIPTLDSVIPDDIDHDVDVAVFEKETGWIIWDRGLCWIPPFYGNVEDPYRQHSAIVSHDTLAIGLPSDGPLIVKFAEAGTWDRLCSMEAGTLSEIIWDPICFFKLDEGALTGRYQNMLHHYMNFAYHSEDFLIKNGVNSLPNESVVQFFCEEPVSCKYA
ncbi:hypothetical protein IW261DRAFT_1467492 [Armillaria novae-zelandiae]|uniref:Nephrocystin 3-like N-terminal domain-containing protein n=1 Tax=Armillaria novae-zelandiae TaxID=153914 RepID=A0AA39PDQ8_9AGAR|nr:hypothetical protein IW261DRAFT_1467492 [Armillaria novae-zelandiae]